MNPLNLNKNELAKQQKKYRQERLTVAIELTQLRNKAQSSQFTQREEARLTKLTKRYEQIAGIHKAG
ncbi:hypothetical protein FHQ08_09150 [Lactobacillus sp. CC-MHH1034]|uniref:hypothetical protein n=1 Tax=Agrilactobacillus fermenti TaxID=2586909 RepID=UPI001E35C992|nr:hypothetical protein [Agrilactobacillus fermenti]MCD2256888.1 hypothetical protein [Agrilactobacillus fermenti]